MENSITISPDHIFSLIRAGLGLETPEVRLSPDEISELLRFGKRQNILSIIYWGLKQTCASFDSDSGKSLDSAWGKVVWCHVLKNESLKMIRNTLDQAQIPYILLKGAVLQHLYPSPEMRTCSDWDVLVREEDLERAVETLETKAGFRAHDRAYHDVPLVNRNVLLELHFNLKEEMENIDSLLSKAWDYAEPSGEGSTYSFTPEFQIFHVIAHMSYHMAHGGLGIRPFIDLWLLRNRTEYDEATVEQMCIDTGILTFYQKSCQLADLWLEQNSVLENVNTEDMKLLESFCLQGGVFGTRENAAASGMRKRSGLDHIFRRLFTSKNILEAEYPVLKEKSWLFMKCQVKRWRRLLDPHKRKQISEELRAVREISPDQVEEYDRLLESLGL